MTSKPAPEIDRRGNRWIGAGGAFGLAGGALAILIPVVLIEIQRYAPGGIAAASSSLTTWSSYLILAGAAFLFLSLFAYRWAYSLLRKTDSRYWTASALCLVGSSGLLLIIIADAVLTGHENGLLSCVKGSYSQIYSCIQGQTPLGAYTGIVGLWLTWIGYIGIVIGLFVAGGRFLSVAYTGAAACYLVILVLLAGPLTGTFVSIPYVADLIPLASAFVIAGPALVLLAHPSIPKELEPPAAPAA